MVRYESNSETVLIEDLNEKLRDPEIKKDENKVMGIMKIIKRARKGQYHDFKTPYATPKMILGYELRALGFEDLWRNTIDGKYDDNIIRDGDADGNNN